MVEESVIREFITHGRRRELYLTAEIISEYSRRVKVDDRAKIPKTQPCSERERISDKESIKRGRLNRVWTGFLQAHAQ
jgi:hypothetical protein